METLLSLSFDNISAKDTTKVRKGLRQIEGLLAQICLAREGLKSAHKRTASVLQDQEDKPRRTLNQVTQDPAFREFFRLQDGFEWNVATRLIGCLEGLLGMSPNDMTNTLILSALTLLQGALLLHPPSRTLFKREIYMNTLLDLLDTANPPEIQSQALLVLVSALLATPSNTRTFEKLDGLLTVSSLSKSKNASKEVKMKAVEFFYFYLMPEGFDATASQEMRANNRDAKIKKQGNASPPGTLTKSTKEKQQMLGQYLNNVSELVQDLQEAAPLQVMA